MLLANYGRNRPRNALARSSFNLSALRSPSDVAVPCSLRGRRQKKPGAKNKLQLAAKLAAAAQRAVRLPTVPEEAERFIV